MAGRLVIALILLAAASIAAEAPFPDAVELSGKWQPAVWATPENPKAQRPKNVDAAGLAALPDDVSLTATEPVKFTHLQWGDCRLQFELKGKASVKIMGIYDVVALSGYDGDSWAKYEVRFIAPRWKGGKVSARPKLGIDVNGKTVRMISPAPPPPSEKNRINEIGEQYGPLHLEAIAGEATLRNIWVGPLEPARDPSSKPWRNMFDGESFKGWTFNGGDAKYRIEGNEIVGTTVPKTPNTFLITERDYENFEFSVEVFGSVEFNAGIQFRSLARGGRGRRNRTMGYQCEIDPSDRRWTAGVYDEARRGWLQPLCYMPERRMPLEKGRWHEFRIFADGSVIKTYLDGKLITHIYDAMTKRGYFGLQVHGIRGEETHDIRWRNVRIRELD